MTAARDSVPAAPASLRHGIEAMLGRTRRRTLMLVESLSEAALNEVHDPLMSPIVWDLGHIANFEELWLVRRVGGERAVLETPSDVYDPFKAPRSERGKLPYLRSEDCLAYMQAVRERTLSCLDRADLEGDDPLLAGGFLYELIARHEQQHSETILQALQIMTLEHYVPQRAVSLPSGGEPRREMTLIDGGPFEMGAGDGWFSYDNERPRHSVALEPFWIDTAPVTNEAMMQFVRDGGYERRQWWSDRGWEWKEREQITLPKYWQREEGEFAFRSFGAVRAVEPARPACHVSWHEAKAFSRWAGKRLPTEAEWEMAACWDAEQDDKRRYPWGEAPADRRRANLDQLAFGTAEVGAFPNGASAFGVHQMVGDVWEWTASPFERYEGFEPFPYPEYSEPFFGDRFRVLRGGSWATQPATVTTSFRNWDYPERRQLFAGFRCARDAETA